MKKFITTAGILSLALPLVVAAQANPRLGNVNDIAGGLGDIVTSLVPIAFTAAVLFFFWGLALYISAAGDESAQEKGKNIMLWGVIALFVMSSVWGLVVFIRTGLGVNQNTDIGIPTVTQ